MRVGVAVGGPAVGGPPGVAHAGGARSALPASVASSAASRLASRPARRRTVSVPRPLTRATPDGVVAPVLHPAQCIDHHIAGGTMPDVADDSAHGDQGSAGADFSAGALEFGPVDNAHQGRKDRFCVPNHSSRAIPNPIRPQAGRCFRLLIRHTGALILWHQQTLRSPGPCRNAKRHTARRRPMTLAGWWSMLSALMNWIALFSNMSAIRKVRSLARQPRPHRPVGMPTPREPGQRYWDGAGWTQWTNPPGTAHRANV